MPPSRPDVVGDLVGLLGLAGDLRLADHHGVEGRGHPKEVANRRPSEVDVEPVVVRAVGMRRR